MEWLDYLQFRNPVISILLWRDDKYSQVCVSSFGLFLENSLFTPENWKKFPLWHQNFPRKSKSSSQIIWRSAIFLDVGSLVTGHWSLVTGHWSLVTGHWSLVDGHWGLGTGTGHWVLVTGPLHYLSFCLRL